MIRPFDLSGAHPAARALWSYWEEIHPPRGLPGRQHFDPAAVAHLLPNIVLVEVHRAPFRFRYRLLGTRVDSINLQNLGGLWLDEAYANHPKAANVLSEYLRVAELAEPVWRRGEPNVVPVPGCRVIEVVRLPLASDGRVVDMILCLTLYFDESGQPLDNRMSNLFGAPSAEQGR